MKKQVLTGLTILMAAVFAGCGGPAGENPESSNTAQEGQTSENQTDTGHQAGTAEPEDPVAAFRTAEVYDLTFYYDESITVAEEGDGMLFRYAGESEQQPYIRVYKDAEHSSAELADGLILQSGQDDAFADVAIIGQGIQAGLVFYEEEIDAVYWAVQFYLLEDKDGTIVIEYRLPQNGDTEMIQAMEGFLERTARDINK